MNGQPPYQGPYAPPGQGAPVHAPQQQPYYPPQQQGPPQQQQQPYYPPQQQGQPYQPPPQQPNYGSPAPQGQPPYGPPAGYGAPPPQQQGYPQQPSYPQGPPQQRHPGLNSAYDAMDPALREELEREEADLKNKRGYDSVDYYKLKQPAARGETSESIVRFLPAWPGKLTKGFWHRAYHHYLTVDFEGKRVRLPIPCVRELSQINNPGQPPLPCAICERREYFERIGDKRNADGLDFKSRFFCNVLDCENLQRHWVPDPAAGGVLVPVACVYPIGPALFRKLGAIMHARGEISSLMSGRPIKILCTKVGGEARDVRYDAIDAADSMPIPQGFEQIRLHDLSKLDRVRDYQEVMGWLNAQFGPMQGQPAGYGQQQQPYGQPYQPPPQAQQAQQPYVPQTGYPATGQPHQPPQQAQPHQAQPYQPQQQQAAPSQPFQSQWTGTMCSVCGQPQFTSPGGNTCANGHGGAAPAQAQVAGQSYAIPPQQAPQGQQGPPPQQQAPYQPPPQQQPPQGQQSPQQQAPYQPPPQQPAAQQQAPQGSPDDDQIPF